MRLVVPSVVVSLVSCVCVSVYMSLRWCQIDAWSHCSSIVVCLYCFTWRRYALLRAPSSYLGLFISIYQPAQLHNRIFGCTRWYDFVSNNDVLRRTGLLTASSIVRKRRLGLFGHVTRLTKDVPANQILRTCCEVQDGVRPSPDWKRARGRPPITWIHQICRDTGISVTDALQLAEDRSLWRQIATAECYG